VPQVVVRRRQALWHSCATVETDYPLGEAAGRSVEAGGIQTGRGRAFLDEVSQDLEHLRGIDDDGDDLHGTVTTRATERALAGLRPAVGAPVSVRDRSGGSPLQAGALRPVVDRHCVAVRRGEEQRKTNDQSAG
jgi:hypothetical protein